MRAIVDWGAGRYETTAAELEPVARAVVEQAAPSAGDDVLDVGCGTGNAALLAAAGGARVIGVDGAPRLLEVAGQRARAQGVMLEVRQGDLLALPVDNAAFDIVLSVFAVIFAPDPGRALREIARVLRTSGRVLLSAWVPAGPIDDMLAAMGRIIGRVTGAPPPQRFAWSDPAALAPLAAGAGLMLMRTTRAELPIRATSPAAYVAAQSEHPMALAVREILHGPMPKHRYGRR
ncbi:class I SAM-dependent methyltransferase [Paenarthrobacter sp. PH39-S1]|uniref:class I SAM-dependent methyltransferase n=1 Tax=Paenarthrobacter sp. PH39-S1 TaxID=3046204 RepID=UPI0032D91CF2